MKPRRRKNSYLPLSYLVAAMALVALLLPSILRPPQDLQSTSTAFSPDAPPDDTPPEALLQSLRRASSSTAGGKTETTTPPTVEEAAEEVEVAIGPERRPRASRNKCYGDPPRQTESLYSALCVPAFTGDNGGKTAPGVYPDEIRLAIAVPLQWAGQEGKLDRDFAETDSDDERLLKVWQTYFNERFETYTRYMQFYVIKQSGTEEDLQRASVNTAKTEYDAFAMFGNGAAGVNEAIRLKIIDFGSVNNPVDFYNDAFPYAYSFYMDSWQTRYLATELACKHFVGKPPGQLNQQQDLTFDYKAPRKWGLVTYQDPTRQGATKMYTDLMAKCGARFEATQEYNLTDNQQNIAGTVAKMRQAQVTTIMFGTDSVTPIAMMREAESLQYYPEWIHSGTGGIDRNTEADGYTDNQARHLIGFSPNELPRPEEDLDYYRAYKEVDPEGEPDSAYFRSLQQFVGAVQHAGPDLNANTFWEGMRKQPYRTPDPEWAIGGGYRDSLEFVPQKDLTYMDFMTLEWFDPDLGSLDTDERYCHLHGGKRYRVGEIPTEPLPWFDRSQCITEAPKGVQG